MPLHRSTVGRMPSSTRVCQWMHSIKRGGVRNSSLLRACAIEPKLSQVLGVFCTPSIGSGGSTEAHSAIGKWEIGVQLSICETLAWSAVRKGKGCPLERMFRLCYGHSGLHLPALVVRTLRTDFLWHQVRSLYLLRRKNSRTCAPQRLALFVVHHTFRVGRAWQW